jgi:prophage antirepressor-like protein
MAVNNFVNPINVNNSSVALAAASRNEVELVCRTTFMGREINIYGSVENPLFLANEVAEWIEHSDASRMLLGIDEEEKLKRTLFVSGQRRECNLLTEDGLYEVFMQSRKPIAKQFKKGLKQILKDIRRQGYFVSPMYQMNSTAQPKPLPVKDQLLWVKEVKKIMNLNDASTLGMLQQIAQPLNLPVPDYVPSKGFVASATDLLEKHGFKGKVSAGKFNAIMEEKGYVERRDLKTKEGIKKYPVLTEEGLKWGENQVHPQNQNICFLPMVHIQNY